MSTGEIFVPPDHYFDTPAKPAPRGTPVYEITLGARNGMSINVLTITPPYMADYGRYTSRDPVGYLMPADEADA